MTWAVATPFFAMPLPLTLLAWDLYGGFAIHGRILLGLVLVGALGGALFGSGRQERRWTLPALPPGVASSAHRVESIVLLLILSQVLALSSVAVAPGVARLLQLWRPGGAGDSADTVLARLIYAALVVYVGLRTTSDDDGDRRLGGTLAVGWLLLVAGEFLVLVGRVPSWTAAVLLALGGLALVRWPLSPRAAGVLGRAAPALFLGSFAWLLLSRAPEVLFGLDPRPFRIRAGVGVLALLVTAGVYRLLPARPVVGRLLRALLKGFAAATTGVSTKNGGPAGLTVTGALAGLALAVLSLPLATLGGLCGELSIPALHLGPEPTGAITIAGPSRFGDLGLVLGMLRLGMVTRDGQGLSRLFRWVGAAFTLCAIAGVGSILAPPLQLGADLTLLAMGIAPWFSSAWDRRALHRWTGGLLVLAPVVGLPVVARYVVAAFPAAGDPTALATIGALLGLPLGMLAARIRLPETLTPAQLLGRAVLGLLFLGLLIYLAVFFAIAPVLFLVTVGILGAATLASRAPGWPLPRVSFAVAAWLAFYASFGAVVLFKEGPGPEACAEVIGGTEARVLLDRYGEGGLYPTGDPYDLLPDPTGRWLVTTFKRFDDHGGWIEVLDVTDPSRRTRTLTKPPDDDAPFWPERFVVHPGTGRYYFGMLGIGQYELWEMELQPGPDGVPSIERVRSQPMTWEPSYPDVDVARNRLVQSYLSAGVETDSRANAEQPLAHPIDLDTLEGSRGFSMGPDIEEMSEFVKVHPTTGDYYVPGYFNLVRFALVEIDGDTLQLKRRRETFHPTIAVGFDGPSVFVTNSLGGTLDVYDLGTLERVAAVKSGAFPRDLVVDREAERVYVGNYSSGTVVEFDVSAQTPVAVRTVEVGPLLRGIGIHEASGAVYAASACGVFEVTGARR